MELGEQVLVYAGLRMAETATARTGFRDDFARCVAAAMTAAFAANLTAMGMPVSEDNPKALRAGTRVAAEVRGFPEGLTPVQLKSALDPLPNEFPEAYPVGNPVRDAVDAAITRSLAG